MTGLPKKLAEKLEGRKRNNNLRSLAVESSLIDFSTNDYLGFSRNRKLGQSAQQILSDNSVSGNGATGSRLLTGNNILYSRLEDVLCGYHQSESALVFNSGYDANIGFFASVPQRNDIVFYDEYIHASIRDGIKLGNARAYKFKHNNLEDLRTSVTQKKKLLAETGVKAYLVTESVFSMDGDSPDLGGLFEICERFKIRLIVDEAHAIGVFGQGGRGMLYDLGLEQRIFARMITFGKALGCHGAAILGSEALKTYLVNFARSLIYTTGLPPHSLASILAAYDIMQSEFGSLQQHLLRERIAYFNEVLADLELNAHFIRSNSAIHCCLIGGNKDVRQLAGALKHLGMDVRPIMYPTVPEGKERLRLCLHAFNSKQEILGVLKALKESIMDSPSIRR